MTNEATHSGLDAALTLGTGLNSHVVVPRPARSAAVSPTLPSADPARLHAQLASVLADCVSETQATSRWLTIACQTLEARLVALYGCGGVGEFLGNASPSKPLAPLPLLGVTNAGFTDLETEAGGAFKRPLHALACKAFADGVAQFARIGNDSGQLAVAVPVSRADGAPEVIAVLFPDGPRESTGLARIAREVQLHAGFASAWRGRGAVPIRKSSDSEGPQAEAVPIQSPMKLESELASNAALQTAGAPKPSLAREPGLVDAGAEENRASIDGASHATDTVRSDDLLTALAATGAARSTDDVAAWWCRFGSQQTAARMVAMGRLRLGGTCRLSAVAPERKFLSTAPLVAALEAVMAESILNPERTSGPRRERRATQAMQQLRELSGAAQVRPLLLRDAAGQLLGVCLVLGDRPWTEEEWTQCESWGRWAGVHLGLDQAARRWIPARITHRWRSTPGRQRLRVALIASTLSAALLLVPFPCHVSCQGELQPEVRRVVVAPQEGRLEQTLVSPGDRVTAGQAVARLDGRELRLELAALEAERARAAKERDRSMAAGDTAASQLAMLELQRLDFKRQWVDSRLEQLEIRSPIDGQVIGGDPRQLQGSQVAQGQSLVEIAPPDRLILEVSIPDADIDRSVVGRTVHCRLESQPHVRLQGTLKSIRPRAEVRDGANVFVGLVELQRSRDGEAVELRSGMRGRARLDADPKSLAWQAFHRVWEHLQFRWGW